MIVLVPPSPPGTRWKTPPPHHKYVFTQTIEMVHLSESEGRGTAVLVELVARKIQVCEAREDLEDGNDHHDALLAKVVEREIQAPQLREGREDGHKDHDAILVQVVG